VLIGFDQLDGQHVYGSGRAAGQLGNLGHWDLAPCQWDFEADRRKREELTTRFLDALRDGDVDGVRELLAADVQMVGDGGGKAPAFARSVIGADNVARVLASIFPLLARIDARVEPREVNGQPGAILHDRDGKVVGTLTLDVLGGRIQTIRALVNPDKLGHLGPVADAWAIAREVKQARRSND
jgi:RNA polymerase sigma-70 factor, ECF subfamily